MNKVKENFRDASADEFGREGFTLIEVTIAMIIFLVALLGIFVTFTYAVNYNNGNASRSQALAILQREVELFRSAKFTPNVTDNFTSVSPDDGRRDLTGGIKPTRTLKAADGSKIRVAVIVDDDPFTPNNPNPQIDATNKSVTMKEVSITVTLDNPTPGWQTSSPATVVLRRVRAN